MCGCDGRAGEVAEEDVCKCSRKKGGHIGGLCQEAWSCGGVGGTRGHRKVVGDMDFGDLTCRGTWREN